MLIEVCLSIITIMLVILVFIAIRMFFQIRKSVNLLQSDFHDLSIEMTRLVTSMNEFVQADLHTISEGATHLISKLDSLSADIKSKSRSLSFLFQPFAFLNSKLSSDSSNDESTPHQQAIPQILKWVVSSAFLFKKTREFIKNHGK